MELFAQDLLHLLVAIHHFSHDERVCAHEGARKSVEIWNVLPAREPARYALLVPDILEMGRSAQSVRQGMLRRAATADEVAMGTNMACADHLGIF